MKIGVITFWYGNGNYGMMLQCWALQQVLKEIGHQPFVIRYSRKLRKGVPRLFLEMLGLYSLVLSIVNPSKAKLLQGKKKHDAQRQFEIFRQTHLTFSEHTYYSLKQIQQRPPLAECYIAGSDQIWSLNPSEENNQAYFLNFGDKRVKRISYAPSFGFSLYPETLSSSLKKLLSRLDAVSCREQSGVNICQSIGINATKVIDPTLLLDKSYYISLASKGTSITDHPFIFIYSLNIQDSEEIRFKELRRCFADKSYQFLVTPADGYYQGEELFGSDVIYSYATIEQWIYNIYNSDLLVTSSFHGICMAVILEKPFIYMPLGGYHSNSNGRIMDLLQILNLESRILLNERKYKDLLQHNIDWKDVKQRLDRNKQSSLTFLNDSLSITKSKYYDAVN